MAKKETIDFGGVPKEIRRGGGGNRVPEGEYECKILNVKKAWKDNDKSNTPYFAWEFQISKGEHKGKGPYRYTTSLKPEALFNLRNLINAAMGKNVAGKSVSFDPETLVGKKIGVMMQDVAGRDDNKDKVYSNAVDVFPVSEMEEDDEDSDEEETEDEETEDSDEDEDLDEVDVEDL